MNPFDRRLVCASSLVVAAVFVACGEEALPTDGDVPEAQGGQGGAAPGGGGVASGSGGASGGSAGQMEPPTDTMPSRPLGIIPNQAYLDDTVNLSRDDWQKGIISPVLESEHHNQPTVINGYLQLTGNARFSTFDIEDPTHPVMIAEAISPDGDGEAEGHQVSFARYGDDIYTVTISGKGVDIWDITEPKQPEHVKSIPLEGVDYGDFTEAVWGVTWQGSTIYVGGTNTGIHVLDARDPRDVAFVKRVPTSMFGGVSAGPLYAVGNVLVVTTPKESGGVATLDISDPKNPIPLDAFTTTKSYIGAFYGRHVYLQSPLRAWDVLSDPTTIGKADSPVGTLDVGATEYMSFSDGYMFAGHLRPNPGASKIDVHDPAKMTVKSRIWGRMDLTGNDDQFTVAIGNLLVLSDDQLAGGKYVGTVIGVHSAAPDTMPPSVHTIVPRDGAQGQATTTRIGISFTDNVELATVDANGFIVRPVGGEKISGSWGAYMSVLNFAPNEPLEPNTTYEVVLPKGRITDYVGNGLAEEFRSTFTTR